MGYKQTTMKSPQRVWVRFAWVRQSATKAQWLYRTATNGTPRTQRLWERGRRFSKKKKKEKSRKKKTKLKHLKKKERLKDAAAVDVDEHDDDVATKPKPNPKSESEQHKAAGRGQ